MFIQQKNIYEENLLMEIYFYCFSQEKNEIQRKDQETQNFM